MKILALMRSAAKLFARKRSFNVNGWTYDFTPIKGGVCSTITNPQGQTLRPVLMPRAGYDWFRHE